MANAPHMKLTHCALFVSDLATMEDFYTGLMDLTVTDRSLIVAGDATLGMVFMSSDPAEHHEFVLINGRPDDAVFNLA